MSSCERSSGFRARKSRTDASGENAPPSAGFVVVSGEAGCRVSGRLLRGRFGPWPGPVVFVPGAEIDGRSSRRGPQGGPFAEPETARIEGGGRRRPWRGGPRQFSRTHLTASFGFGPSRDADRVGGTDFGMASRELWRRRANGRKGRDDGGGGPPTMGGWCRRGCLWAARWRIGSGGERYRNIN